MKWSAYGISFKRTSFHAHVVANTSLVEIADFTLAVLAVAIAPLTLAQVRRGGQRSSRQESKERKREDMHHDEGNVPLLSSVGGWVGLAKGSVGENCDCCCLRRCFELVEIELMMAIRRRIFDLFIYSQPMLGTAESSSGDAPIVNHLDEHDAQPPKAQDAQPTTRVAGASIFALSRPESSLLPERTTFMAGVRAMGL